MALSLPVSPGRHGCLPSISAHCGYPQWARCGGAAPRPLSPSGRGSAVFVLLVAPVISAQHTQEVLSGIVHPRPDLYRKKSIKSRPSTSAATSCLCVAGGRPCWGRKAGVQAGWSQGGQAGMAAGSHGGAQRRGCSWHGRGQQGTSGTVRARGCHRGGDEVDGTGWGAGAGGAAGVCPCQARPHGLQGGLLYHPRR